MAQLGKELEDGELQAGQLLLCPVGLQACH